MDTIATGTDQQTDRRFRERCRVRPALRTPARINIIYKYIYIYIYLEKTSCFSLSLPISIYKYLSWYGCRFQQLLPSVQ